MQNIVKGLKTS